jgi:hypothetical protein
MCGDRRLTPEEGHSRGKWNRWTTNPRSPKCQMIDNLRSIEGHTTSGGLLWKINTLERKELGTYEARLLKFRAPKSRISTIDLALGHILWSHGFGAERKGLVPEKLLQSSAELRKKRSARILD